MTTWKVTVNNVEIFTVKAGQTLNVTADRLPCSLEGKENYMYINFVTPWGTVGAEFHSNMESNLEGRIVKVVRT